MMAGSMIHKTLQFTSNSRGPLTWPLDSERAQAASGAWAGTTSGTQLKPPARAAGLEPTGSAVASLVESPRLSTQARDSGPPNLRAIGV